MLAYLADVEMVIGYRIRMSLSSNRTQSKRSISILYRFHRRKMRYRQHWMQAVNIKRRRNRNDIAQRL